MPQKNAKTGRPSKGRNGPRYNLNVRAVVQGPIARLVALYQLEENRHISRSEAIEMAVREAIEARGYEYEESGDDS